MTPRALPEVVIARSAFEDVYEPAWSRALSEIGVPNWLFDTHRHVGRGIVGRIQQRLLAGPGIRRANRALVQIVKQMRPDVTLLYQGHHFDRRTIASLRALTFVVGAHNDDPTGPRAHMLRYRHLRRALPSYHGYHVYRPVNVAELRALGVPRVGLLLPSYLPWADYPRELGPAENVRWGCDIVFAGHPEPDERLACIERAVRAGHKVRLYGDPRAWRRWLSPDTFRAAGPEGKVHGDDYRKALCGARIAACFLSSWNRDEYTRRAFEIPACGVFLLAKRTGSMQRLYEADREAVFFDSPDEFLSRASHYLRDEPARRQIARAGRTRALSSGYDIHSRARQWLEDVLEWKAQVEHEFGAGR